MEMGQGTFYFYIYLPVGWQFTCQSDKKNTGWTIKKERRIKWKTTKKILKMFFRNENDVNDWLNGAHENEYVIFLLCLLAVCFLLSAHSQLYRQYGAFFRFILCKIYYLLLLLLLHHLLDYAHTTQFRLLKL